MNQPVNYPKNNTLLETEVFKELKAINSKEINDFQQLVDVLIPKIKSVAHQKSKN